MSKNQEACTITIGGQERAGMFPRLPVRFFLQTKLRKALGIDGDVADGYGITMVYFAIVGVCWPTPIEPSLGACRHDVNEYGAVVFEHLAELYPDADLSSEVSDLGLSLLGDMLGKSKELDEAAKNEAGFTEGTAETSTTE